MLQSIEQEDFNKKIKESSKPILIDFSATWCAPCRAMKPQLEQLAEEMKESVDIYVVDVDSCPDVRDDNNIQSVPALVLFKDGEEIERLVGYHPKPEIATRLSQWL